MTSIKPLIETLQKNIESLEEFIDENPGPETVKLDEVINDLEYVINELEEL